MSANVKNIMANANLTEAEGRIVVDNLAVAADLFPFFKERLSESFPAQNMTEDTDEETEKISGKNYKNEMHIYIYIYIYINIPNKERNFNACHRNRLLNFVDSQLLTEASKMLCGKEVMQESGRLYKFIYTLEDTNKAYDQKEFNALPGKKNKWGMKSE